MKKIYFLLITLLTGAAAWSQTTWDGDISSDWTEPQNWTNGVPSATNLATFDIGGSLTVTNVSAGTIGSILVTNNTNLTLQRSSAGALTISNANGNVNNDFTIDAGSELIIGTNLSITLANNAKASVAGRLTVNSGRTYDTDNNNTATTVTGSGIIDNRGIVTSTSNHRLIFQNGATYIHGRDGGSIPEADWDNNSNCNVTGVVATIPTAATFGQDFGNFTWNCPSQTGSLSFAGNLEDIAGDITVANTGITGAINLGANFTTTVGGDYIQTGGTLILISSAGTCDFELMGNFNMSGGVLRRTGGTCDFIFDRNGAQTFTKTGGVIDGVINFRIDNGSEVDFGTSVLDGSSATFNLNSQGKIITAHPGGLSSTGATGAIQVGGTRTFSNNADYEFRGSSTGSFATTGSQVKNLVINNTTTNEVSAARVFVISGELTLMNGYLTTTAGQVTIATGGTASTSNGAFVNGPLAKNTNNQNAFTFPVGEAGSGLRIIGVKPTANTASTFTAQFYRAAAPAGTLAATLNRVSGCEYWDLARTAGTANAAVTLSWESGSACSGSGYVTSLADLRVAHLSGGIWLNEGNVAISGDPTAGTVTSGTVTSFSPFALASSSAANPLPVVFGDVKAYEKNNGVQIEWSNLTEKDVADYTVERAADGRNFSGIAQQLPTSNQNDRIDYTSFDANPAQGINYYRIKAVETTGKVVYSKVLSVSLGQASKGLKLYPNPVSGNQVTISLSNVKHGQYNLRVVNTAGQDIYKQTINNQGSTTTQTIDLPTSVKPGVYSMVVTGSDYRESKMFIVQ